MPSLSHSLIILIDLDLPIPLNWKTTTLGSSDFPVVDTEIVRDKLYQFINPWDIVGFILEY